MQRSSERLTNGGIGGRQKYHPLRKREDDAVIETTRGGAHWFIFALRRHLYAVVCWGKEASYEGM